MTGSSGRAWAIVKLGDWVTFKTGKLNSNASKLDGKYPFFTCSQETLRTDTFSFDTECVLLAGNNANGVYPLKYFKGKFDAYQRTYVIRSVDSEHLTNRFLYYALLPKLEHLRSISTGAATKFLTLTLLRDVTFEKPPSKIQERVAEVLSGYDDLIENNTQRIKILEQMAQMLYREWFVSFRFPGHENVKMVASESGLIPEGWEIKRMDDVASITMGQSPPSEHYNKDGIGLPFHQGVTDFGPRFPVNRSFCISEGRIAEGGDTLMSVRAPVGRLNITLEKIVIGRGLCAIRSRFGSQQLIFQQLRERFREEDSMGSGTIFKAVTKEDVCGLKLVHPPSAVNVSFIQTVGPMFKELEVLTAKNRNLCVTRDMLLPKLVSGDVSVEQIEQEVVAEMV